MKTTNYLKLKFDLGQSKEIYTRIKLDAANTRNYTGIYKKPHPEASEAFEALVERDRILKEEDNEYQDFFDNLYKIEAFVSEVIASKKPAFKLDQNKFGAILRRVHPLDGYFCKVNKFIYNLSFKRVEFYEFSAYVQIFIDCWTKLNLGSVYFFEPKALTSYICKDGISSENQPQYEIFNRFIELIREESRNPEFTKRLRKAKENVKNRCSSAEEYVEELFTKSKRLLVLRLDLWYRVDVKNYNTFITQSNIEQAKRDLSHLLNNKRSNKAIFGGWLGYIRKMEWAPQKGIHFHMIIFFDGNVRFLDQHLAKQIGEYWKKITDGRGLYWNCSADKEEYKKLGIGITKIDEIDKRKVLLDDVVRYLAKTDQYLRYRGFDISNKNIKNKLFVMGLIPRKG